MKMSADVSAERLWRLLRLRVHDVVQRSEADRRRKQARRWMIRRPAGETKR